MGTKVVKLNLWKSKGILHNEQNPILLPRLCVACGGVPSPIHTHNVHISAGVQRGYTGEMTFPLCDECHEIWEQGRKASTGMAALSSRFLPEELRDRYRQIEHAVDVTFGSDVGTFKFGNEAFGQAFEALNANSLNWASRLERRMRPSMS